MLEIIDGRDRNAPVHIGRPRPVGAGRDAENFVRSVVEDVRLRGDEAVIEHTERASRARLTRDRLRVEPKEITAALRLVPPELIAALEVLRERLRRIGERQVPETWVDSSGDEVVGELVRPLRRVGVHVPGAPRPAPSVVLMAAVPAAIAGVDTVAVCSPPDGRGEVAEPVLAACAVAAVTEVYRTGGPHGVAALAYGSESIRPVEKIVGPGGESVDLAKRAVSGWVGTDAPGGAVELAILADETARAEVVAADLVAAAEAGPHGTFALVTWEPELVDRVTALLELRVAGHPRPDDVENALIEGGRAAIVRDLHHGLETVNALAPQRLQLLIAGAADVVDEVRNAGAVFVGPSTPGAAGGAAAGTNDLLPSNGAARWRSGLGAHDFVKRIYLSGMESSALERMAGHVDALAEAEGLPGRSAAVDARLGPGS